MNKNIFEMMKNWGNGNRKSPADNLVLKNKILSEMQFIPEAEEKKARRHFFPVIPMAFAALSVLVIVASSINPLGRGLQNSVSLPTSEKAGMQYPSAPSVSNQDVSYRYNEYGSPITDPREFLKTSYHATVRTRDVSDTRDKVELIVRGLGGRIDASSASEKNGYISYSIPAIKLSIFQREVKELTGKKLFTENINSENLLPQKQSIESNQRQLEDTLSSLNTERAQLVSAHKKTSQSYQLRIAKISQDLTVLQAEWQYASPDRKNQINVELAELSYEKTTLEAQLRNENTAYQNKLSDVDSRIKYTQNDLGSVYQEDINLIDNVATVSGSITLNWVSLWGVADIYTPGPLLAWILAALAVLSYWRHKRSQYLQF